LQAVVRPSLKQLLMQKETRTTGLVAARGQAKRRKPQTLD
jgi:hypothetical protein